MFPLLPSQVLSGQVPVIPSTSTSGWFQIKNPTRSIPRPLRKVPSSVPEATLTPEAKAEKHAAKLRARGRTLTLSIKHKLGKISNEDFLAAINENDVMLR